MEIIEWYFANFSILIEVLFSQSINLRWSGLEFILEKIFHYYIEVGEGGPGGESLLEYFNISTWSGPGLLLSFQIRHPHPERLQAASCQLPDKKILRAASPLSLHHPHTASETSPSTPLLSQTQARRQNIRPARAIPGMFMYFSLLAVIASIST